MTEPVTVVEVGPRDGLQNECAVLSTDVKLAFVRALASAGLSRIEVAAFVRPDRVPAMADAAKVAAVAKDVVPDASALVPPNAPRTLKRYCSNAKSSLDTQTLL